MKVFLGGTVNGSKWRTVVKEKLAIDYFDPVVKDWNDAAYERELSERRFCNYGSCWALSGRANQNIVFFEYI